MVAASGQAIETGGGALRACRILSCTTASLPMNLFSADTPADIERCYPVMSELRPHLSRQDFLAIHAQASASDGYRLVAIEREGEILAVMGYRFLSDYVRGRHLYIDDLVSTARARSQGLGSMLLQHAEHVAAAAGCKILRLCTGIENAGGVRFYDRNGWTKRAYAFTKTLV
jgi:GNAT superfamily N-acetyltransferase